MQIFRIQAADDAHVVQLAAEGSQTVEGGIGNVVLHHGKVHITGLDQTHVLTGSTGSLGRHGDGAVALVGDHLGNGTAQGEIHPGGPAGSQGPAKRPAADPRPGQD